MKLIERTSERTLLRRKGEPYYQPWSNWAIVDGTSGLTEDELRQFIYDGEFGERLEWNYDRTFCRVTGAYSRTEYRIIPDIDLFFEGHWVG